MGIGEVLKGNSKAHARRMSTLEESTKSASRKLGAKPPMAILTECRESMSETDANDKPTPCPVKGPRASKGPANPSSPSRRAPGNAQAGKTIPKEATAEPLVHNQGRIQSPAVSSTKRDNGSTLGRKNQRSGTWHDSMSARKSEKCNTAAS